MILVNRRVLETPFRLQISADLGYVVWSRRKRLADGIVGKTAINSAWIVVILEHNRVGAVVRIYGRSRIPPEIVRAQKLAPIAELHQVAAKGVVIRNHSHEHASVRQNCGSRGSLIINRSRAPVVGGRINSQRRALTASIGLVLARSNRHQNATAIMQTPSQ